MRSNDVAAAAVQELADLLAISGGDPYRVRSYEKAARSIARFAQDLDGLDRKGLMEIPAAGAHIADKLLELRKMGRMTRLEELRAQVPAGLRALLGVPGWGPSARIRCMSSWGSRRCRSCWPRCTTSGCAT
jgi:DNA polymerase (family 10)